jgi:MFS family permease
MQPAIADKNPTDLKQPSTRTLWGLDWLNFSRADVQTGVGPFLAIYLAGLAGGGWNPQQVGLALTVGGIAGIATQTPAGALVDRLRSKRALIAVGVAALAVGALLIAVFPWFWPVMAARPCFALRARGTQCPLNFQRHSDQGPTSLPALFA